MADYGIHILCNTHWDREWYMPHEKYLVRLVNLMDRMLDILDREPEYHFITDGQYSMVQDYLEVRPEARERVSEKIRNGQLAVGPWYTQPLETLVSGEAMVRNLHCGIRKSEELGGAMRFSYEVDEFGHASQTPQVLHGFGIPAALAWRGNPHGAESAYTWRAPDGTDVVMFYTNRGYGEATNLPPRRDDHSETIDGIVYPIAGLDRRVDMLMKLRLANSRTSELLWLNGVDHAWLQPDLPEVIRKIRASHPELDVKISTCEKYMNAVLGDLNEKGIEMRVVTGELMEIVESVLESVHSFHPRQKLRHYRTEHFLSGRLEPAAAEAWLVGADAREWELDRAWDYVLQNHAHDTLGCTSVDEVYEEAMARYGCAMSLAEQAAEDSRRDVFACIPGFPMMTVFNTAAFDAKGVTEVDVDVPAGCGDGNFALETEEGVPVSFVPLMREANSDVRYHPGHGHPTVTPCFHVKGLIDLPETNAMGWRALSMKPAARKGQNPAGHYISPEPGVLDNGILRCEIRPDGTVDVTDRASGRTYPKQFMFEDTSDAYTCYVHVPSEQERVVLSAGCAAKTVLLYDTPLGAAYEVRLTMEIPKVSNSAARSEETVPLDIVLVLSLFKDERVLRSNITVTNRAEEHRLRVLFPTHLSGAEKSRGGQPFDVVERPIRVEEALPHEVAYDTKPMQDICDVSDGSFGLTVAAEGLYEYACTDTPARVLAVTLFRANCWIDQNWGCRYRMEAGESKGEMRWRLAVLPHDGDWRKVYPDAVRFLEPADIGLNRMPETAVLRDAAAPAMTLPACGSPVALAGKNMKITAFKKAFDRDSVIVRIWNYGADEAEGALAWTMPGIRLERVYTTDLDENREEERTAENGKIPFRLRAAGLLTLELVPGKE